MDYERALLRLRRALGYHKALEHDYPTVASDVGDVQLGALAETQDDSYPRYNSRIPKLPLQQAMVWGGREWKKTLRVEDGADPGKEGVFMHTRAGQLRFLGQEVADANRIVHISDPEGEILIYVAGAAPFAEPYVEPPPPVFSLRPPASHGTPWQTTSKPKAPVEDISTSGSAPLARAGCAFIYRPEDVKRYSVRFSLEHRGPFLTAPPATVDRATLRAIVAALEYRQIYHEGSKLRAITLAISNEYVYRGLMEYISGWRKHGWKHFDKEIHKRRDFMEVTEEEDDDVADRDLWLAAMARMETLASRRVKAAFVLIPEKKNQAAAALAQHAARFEGLEHYW